MLNLLENPHSKKETVAIHLAEFFSNLFGCWKKDELLNILKIYSKSIKFYWLNLKSSLLNDG